MLLAAHLFSSPHSDILFVDETPVYPHAVPTSQYDYRGADQADVLREGSTKTRATDIFGIQADGVMTDIVLLVPGQKHQICELRITKQNEIKFLERIANAFTPGFPALNRRKSSRASFHENNGSEHDEESSEDESDDEDDSSSSSTSSVRRGRGQPVGSTGRKRNAATITISYVKELLEKALRTRIERMRLLYPPNWNPTSSDKYTPAFNSAVRSIGPRVVSVLEESREASHQQAVKEAGRLQLEIGQLKLKKRRSQQEQATINRLTKELEAEKKEVKRYTKAEKYSHGVVKGLLESVVREKLYEPVGEAAEKVLLVCELSYLGHSETNDDARAKIIQDAINTLPDDSKDDTNCQLAKCMRMYMQPGAWVDNEVMAQYIEDVLQPWARA